MTTAVITLRSAVEIFVVILPKPAVKIPVVMLTKLAVVGFVIQKKGVVQKENGIRVLPVPLDLCFFHI